MWKKKEKNIVYKTTVKIYILTHTFHIYQNNFLIKLRCIRNLCTHLRYMMQFDCTIRSVV